MRFCNMCIILQQQKNTGGPGGRSGSDSPTRLFASEVGTLPARWEGSLACSGGHVRAASPETESPRTSHAPLPSAGPRCLRKPLLCSTLAAQIEPPGLLWGGDCSALAEATG